MKHISESLFPEMKKKRSERGDLLVYIAEKLGWKVSRVAFHVAHLKQIADLHYLKSVCDDAENRWKRTNKKEGCAWAAAFWHETRPKPKSF